MKLQFKNASLVSVINGSIVIKNYAGQKYTFTNASVISVNNGTIVIETEWEPKRGELIKVTNRYIDIYCLFDKIKGDFIYVFGWKKIDCNRHYLKSDNWKINSETKISPVTQEEQKEFDDFCKSHDTIWNKETLQWEKCKWKPKPGEKFYIVCENGKIISYYYDNTLQYHHDLIDINNCFKTEEEAYVKLRKFLEILQK